MTLFFLSLHNKVINNRYTQMGKNALSLYIDKKLKKKLKNK